MSDWQELGGCDPKSLVEDRVSLHYGAWILGSVAHSLLPAAEDDSHTNLGFDRETLSFATRRLEPDRRVRLGLPCKDMALVLEAEGTESILALEGSSFTDALEWVGRALPAPRAMERRDYPDFPASPLRDGADFGEGEETARVEIGLYFANAALVFDALRVREPGLGEVRIWPHHFDLGAVLPIAEGKLVGLGMSPGDGAYAEPYFYAYPYPYPPAEVELPDLESGGRWHTEGFTAAVLRGSDLLQASDPEVATMGFVSQALEVCRSLLLPR